MHTDPLPQMGEPVQQTSPDFLRTVPAVDSPAVSMPEPRRSLGPWLAAALAVIVLFGAIGFYVWHGKSAPGTETAKGTSQPLAPIIEGVPQPAKPTAALPGALPALPPPPAPAGGVLRQPTANPDIASKPVAPVRPVVPPPEPVASPVPPPSAGAGMLRYSGPPVPPGGTVVFAGLPGAMLRFRFDHSLWQPRISHQPDGTQTLTLRSLTQGEQTQCEVQWEVAQ